MKAILDLLLLAILAPIIGLLRILPWSLSVRTARFLLRLVPLIMRRAHDVAKKNLEIVFPERTFEEREAIYQRSWTILASNIAGYAKLPNLTRETACEMFPFEALSPRLAAIRKSANGKGLLFVNLHYGPFERFVQGYALAERPLYLLARGLGFPRLDRWCNARRELFGSKVFARKNAFPEMIRQLKSGMDVALLFDQNVKVNHAVFVKLFGIKAATTKSVALASLRVGCPVIFTVAMEMAPQRYEIYFRELNNPNAYQGTTEEKIEQITRELHTYAEEAIRLKPDHWFWIHRRFKTRPPGEKQDIYET